MKNAYSTGLSFKCNISVFSNKTSTNNRCYIFRSKCRRIDGNIGWVHFTLSLRLLFSALALCFNNKNSTISSQWIYGEMKSNVLIRMNLLFVVFLTCVYLKFIVCIFTTKTSIAHTFILHTQIHWLSGIPNNNSNNNHNIIVDRTQNHAYMHKHSLVIFQSICIRCTHKHHQICFVCCFFRFLDQNSTFSFQSLNAKHCVFIVLILQSQRSARFQREQKDKKKLFWFTLDENAKRTDNIKNNNRKQQQQRIAS